MHLPAPTPVVRSQKKAKRSSSPVAFNRSTKDVRVLHDADHDELSVVAVRVAHLGGWRADLREGVVYLSDEACAIHDLPAGSTFPVTDAAAAYAPDSRPAISAALSDLAEDGIPCDIEVAIVTAKGRQLPVRIIGEAVRDADGRIVQLQGSFQDISSFRAMERSLHQFSDAHYTLDRDWRFTYVNAEAERLLGHRGADLLGQSVWDASLFPEIEGTIFDVEFHRAMETGQPRDFDAFYPPLDLWSAVRAFPSDAGLAVYFQDVSARRAIEEARAASEQRYRALFERAGDAIFIADDTGHFVDVNNSAATLIGLSREEIIGRRLNDFLADVLEPFDADAAWNTMRKAGEMRGEVRLRRSDGEVRETEYVAVAEVSLGLHLGVLRDITERRRHERAATVRAQILQALRRLSPGTKPEFTADAICQEIVDNGDFMSAAIVAFDTEEGALALGARFRDGRGLSALPPVDERVLDNLMAKAILGPWVEDGSGPDGGPSRTSMASFGVFAAVFAPLEFDGRLIGLISAGSMETPTDLAQRIPTLTEFAALASSLLGPGLRARSDRAAERARFRAIISTRAFRPVFQPIVDMASGEALGYEALTRFADGTPPDQVFAAAANVGLGLALEAATIEAALAASAPLPADCFLDVNVSPDLLMAGEPLRSLLHGAASGVVLEITEHVDVRDYVALREAIAALGDDIRFAVDDAGAGFASFRHILELAPSHVKLDRALIMAIDTDPARQALVAGLVHFADTIDVMLVAEGVETTAERATLLGLGVRAGQGFLFGRPLPPGKIESCRRGRLSRAETPCAGAA
jgi:PAS domain S-box-containing protein